MAEVSPTIEAAYAEAAEVLRDGGVVALPTDTVYGLCTVAADSGAVEAAYAVKERDPRQAMPIFVATLEQAATLGNFNEAARALAAAFWPGPLTIIIPKRAGYVSRATAGEDTVALRVPADERLRALCEQVGPLTGTSANIAGREECHTAAEVRAQIGPRVNLIVDGPVPAEGLPSTIVDCSVQGSARILRDGAVSRQVIETALGRPV
jgi:L-threonylcarbamoyladenylate synthase